MASAAEPGAVLTVVGNVEIITSLVLEIPAQGSHQTRARAGVSNLLTDAAGCLVIHVAV